MAMQGQVILKLASTPGHDIFGLRLGEELAKYYCFPSQRYFICRISRNGLKICMYLTGCLFNLLHSQKHIKSIGFPYITSVLWYRSHDIAPGSLPTSPFARRLHPAPAFCRHQILSNLGHAVPHKVDLHSAIPFEAAFAVVLSRTRRRETR